MAEQEKTKKTSFFKGLRKEFKKITWPTKKDVAKETASVTIISIVVGVIIVLLDKLVQWGISFL